MGASGECDVGGWEVDEAECEGDGVVQEGQGGEGEEDLYLGSEGLMSDGDGWLVRWFDAGWGGGLRGFVVG